MLASSTMNCDVPVNQRVSRNQVIECIRLIASICVVFSHIWFPGKFGQVMDCLARFAVPFFFAVTGYFNYQARIEKIKSRIQYIVKLNLFAIIVHILWDCLEIEYAHGSTIAYLRTSSLTVHQIWEWIVLNIHPNSIHLWYLTAILEIYVILYIYVRFYDEGKINYHTLYLIGFGVFVHTLFFSVYALPADIFVPAELYYNALFVGLPMFALGIFIHEYQDKILKCYRVTTIKLIFLFLSGVCFSLLEWEGLRNYSSDIYFGAIIQVIALLLLAILHPNIIGESRKLAHVISKFGFYSTIIYVFHIIISDAYALLMQSYVITYVGATEEAVRPLIVVVLSLIVAIVLERVYFIIKCLIAKKQV